ncbi:MAG: hypothetical protein CL778_02890 [Chloroflexi bacterium]|nr:hypothetical protein [Chloroflexota bacterium]|tara:strand:- start:40202 stop:41212 length:1011 start_codon:yes stop_codon:yes gene_type:complete
MTNKNIVLNTNKNLQELSWDQISDQWDEVFNSFDGNRFFQSQIVKNIWKKNFGKDSKYKIFVVSDTNNKIISPFKINKNKYTFIGSKDLFDYQDLIYSGHNGIDELLETLVIFLSNDLSINELELDSIPTSSPTIEKITVYLKKYNWDVEISLEDVSPRIILPETFEEYLSSLNKKNRHEIRRKLRRLNKIESVKSYEFSDKKDIKENMGEFFRLLRKSTPDKNNFMTVNRENFFRDISINMSKLGSTRLRFLEVDNKKVATSLSFLKDKVKYLYNSGYDPEYSDLSVGVLNHVLSIQHSILENHLIFDFMRGDEVYKYRLGGVDETVSKVLAKKR